MLRNHLKQKVSRNSVYTRDKCWVPLSYKGTKGEILITSVASETTKGLVERLKVVGKEISSYPYRFSAGAL